MGVPDPFRFVLISIAGWMNQQQQQAIEYLREENKVLREQLGSHRLRFTDEQRRQLAVKAKGLGHRAPIENSLGLCNLRYLGQTLASKPLADLCQRAPLCIDKRSLPGTCALRIRFSAARYST